ncbi:hypothetical protein [Methylobacterium sp. SyP6R]|uniref:hypothetical protein n=1 Tax=Methylobacterium sp. SyP6R TaxID=2718876 RepID=UPI001F193EA5|nr:hypothetical protein [Methylobacterium sp. SyP6R]MCF4129050.1 hypothetical protein [Methylobacterium sp. SyP6R]
MKEATAAEAKLAATDLISELEKSADGGVVFALTPENSRKLSVIINLYFGDSKIFILYSNNITCKNLSMMPRFPSGSTTERVFLFRFINLRTAHKSDASDPHHEKNDGHPCPCAIRAKSSTTGTNRDVARSS